MLLIKERTFGKTKKFFHKTFTNLKSFLVQGYPRNKINSKFQELDNLYPLFSEKWESNKIVKKMESPLPSKNEEAKRSSTNNNEKKKEGKFHDGGRKQNVSRSFAATDILVQKMKELEMIDLNDMDNVLDIEEVLHNYSRLTSPAYQEMVDMFFIDMYSEFHLSRLSRSRNGSTRKLASHSVHSSMRSLGPIKI